MDGGNLDLVDSADCVDRAWTAVTQCAGIERP
jgi:hypothetical protein